MMMSAQGVSMVMELILYLDYDGCTNLASDGSKLVACIEPLSTTWFWHCTIIIKDEAIQGNWRKYMGPLRTIFVKVWVIGWYGWAGLFLGSVCCFSDPSASVPHCHGYWSFKKALSNQIFQSCFLLDLLSTSNFVCLFSETLGAVHPFLHVDYGWDLTDLTNLEDMNYQDTLILLIHGCASVFCIQVFHIFC